MRVRALGWPLLAGLALAGCSTAMPAYDVTSQETVYGDPRYSQDPSMYAAFPGPYYFYGGGYPGPYGPGSAFPKRVSDPLRTRLALSVARSSC